MQEVITLKVPVFFGDTVDFIYPVIIKSYNNMILVDCGYPGFYDRIAEAAAAKNISINKINKIIITHHDYDHVGALAKFKRMNPDMEVIAAEGEKDYIEGKKKSLRLTQAEQIYDSLPEEQKPMAKRLEEMFASVEPVTVDVTVKDGDILKYAGKIEIIKTAGHMPDHISIYLPELKTLIAGDALVVDNGKLAIANPKYCLDLEEAKRTVKKLRDYHIDKIICYHGGEYTGDMKWIFEELMNSIDDVKCG